MERFSQTKLNCEYTVRKTRYKQNKIGSTLFLWNRQYKDLPLLSLFFLYKKIMIFYTETCLIRSPILSVDLLILNPEWNLSHLFFSSRPFHYKFYSGFYTLLLSSDSLFSKVHRSYFVHFRYDTFTCLCQTVRH